jgi:hypothetical protein
MNVVLIMNRSRLLCQLESRTHKDGFPKHAARWTASKRSSMYVDSMCSLRSPRGDVEGNRAITTQDLLRPSISVGPCGTSLGLMEMCRGELTRGQSSRRSPKPGLVVRSIE